MGAKNEAHAERLRRFIESFDLRPLRGPRDAERATRIYRDGRRSGRTGLLAEEIDPTSGELLGTYPQAYSHIGLVNAADVISRLRRDTRPDDAMLPENGG